MRLMAASASSSLSTMKPEMPSSITSGTEPRRNAITGVPHAMASIMTSPNGSGQSIGKSRAAAFLRLALAAIIDLAQQTDLVAVDQWLEVLLVVAVIRARYFGGHAQRRSGGTRQPDGDARTFRV